MNKDIFYGFCPHSLNSKKIMKKDENYISKEKEVLEEKTPF